MTAPITKRRFKGPFQHFHVALLSSPPLIFDAKSNIRACVSVLFLLELKGLIFIILFSSRLRLGKKIMMKTSHFSSRKNTPPRKHEITISCKVALLMRCENIFSGILNFNAKIKGPRFGTLTLHHISDIYTQ